MSFTTLIAKRKHHIEPELACFLSVRYCSLAVSRKESVVLVVKQAFLAVLQGLILGGIDGGECIEVFDQVPYLKALHNG